MFQTPLHAVHRALNGRMVDFAGWDMPVLYTGILEEARAVRSSCGIFDISHMGRVRFAGTGAPDYLQRLTSNDVSMLSPGSAQYSLLTNPTGGIIDDIIVYREEGDSFLVVINAGNTPKDLEWLRDGLVAGVEMTDLSAETAMIAVQGPGAPEMVATLAADRGLLELKRFQVCSGSIVGHSATFCRTGYTGEDGFELIADAAVGPAVWSALINSGAVPCGLGARDALRIEAGYPLYGHEIDETTDPVEAGLMWAVSLDKGDFCGREPIAAVAASGPSRRLVGLTSVERMVPRQGYTISRAGREIGVVTSGVFSPTRGHALGMGYVERRSAKAGTEVEIDVRGRAMGATVVPKKNLLTA